MSDIVPPIITHGPIPDHTHSGTSPFPGYGSPTASVDIGDAQSDGVATTVPRSDHQHAVPAPSTGYPVDVDMSAEADGTATTPARSDHKHHVTAPATGYPQDVAGTEADGTSDAPSRADHVHKGVFSVNGMSGTVVIGGTGGGVSPGRINDPLTTVFDWEEFLGNVATTGAIGKLGWAFVNSSVAYIASEANHPGIISKLQNNNAGSLSLGGATGNFMLLPSEMFDNYFIIRPQSFDGNCSLWPGYQDTLSGTGTANNGCFFEALSTDTNWFAVTGNGIGSQTRHDMTIPCTTGNWYVMRIRRIDSTHIGFTIVSVNGVASGVAEFSQTLTIPTVTLAWALRIRSHTAANRTVEIDYWDQLITLAR